MDKKINPTYKKYRLWIIEALMRLMTTHRFQDITIKQIAYEADISRQTFYRHFRSKEDIVEEYSQDLCQELTRLIASLEEKSIYNIALTYFTFWENHKDLLNLLKNSDSDYIIFDSYQTVINNSLDLLKDILSTPLKDYNFNYIKSFLVGGLYNAKLDWMKNNFHESPETMASLVNAMLHI